MTGDDAWDFSAKGFDPADELKPETPFRVAANLPGFPDRARSEKADNSYKYTLCDLASGQAWNYRAAIGSRFAVRDKVRIDGGNVVGFVTAFTWREISFLIEVSWVSNGLPQAAYVEEWRLSFVEGA